jgi:protein TonB
MKAALFLAASLVVNGALFYGIAAANGAAKAKPVHETWAVREIFSAAPPPRPAPPSDDAPREAVPDLSARVPSPQTVETAAPAPEAFAPRFEAVGLDFSGSMAIGGPLLPLFTGRGGSPDGVAGGRPGGIPGGTGTGLVLRLSQVDRGPQRLATPLPPYPSWARARRIEGVVTLQFTVDAEGGVCDAEIESVEGDERFGPVAMQAIGAWRYEPALVEGKKVPCRIIQRVRFTLVER